MGRGAASGLTVGVIVLVVIVFVIARRMRPQPVNPTRTLALGAIFIVLLVLALGSDFNPFIHDVPAIIAAPFALLLGGALGFVIVRSMTFWVDPQSGLLWMRGGILFAVIYVCALGLRLGTTYLAQSASTNPALRQLTWLHGVSADLLFLSMGMWAVRAALIYNRYRQHVAQGGAPLEPTGPAR